MPRIRSLTNAYRGLLVALSFAVLMTFVPGVSLAAALNDTPPDSVTPGSSAADPKSTEESAGEAEDDAGSADADGTFEKTLKWATASEVDNFGYDIYRGTTPDGPFERVTEEPIPGNGTTDEPSYYSYTASALDSSKDYYFYIESISMHGERERFTPISKVSAKKPKPESEADAESNPES